jgi:succinate-semialdehyde dehydrogenase/glutarate-semialdehyde dehydrogenase
VAAVPKDLYIDGQWRASVSGRTFAVEDPATEETLTEVADGDARDALDALDAASRAQLAWAAHPPRARGVILRRTYELLNERVDDLALLMTMEMGKSLADSRAEIVYAADSFAGSPRKRFASTVATRASQPGAAASSCSDSRWAPAC